jgi:hypothetical protein
MLGGEEVRFVTVFKLTLPSGTEVWWVVVSGDQVKGMSWCQRLWEQSLPSE